MTRKLNCWEFRNCGMEPGGVFSKIHGACPVSLSMKHDGRNGGRAAGRVCWEIMDNPNKLQSEPSCRSNRIPCCQCSFYNRVNYEEEVIVLAEEKQDTKISAIL